MGQTTKDADYISWRGYIGATLEKFAAHSDFGNHYVWNVEKINAAGNRAPRNLDFDDFEGAFIGPWHVVRKWVTTEFRQFIEEYGNTRMTFAEWRAEMIDARAREAQRVVDYQDSAAYCLDELAALRELQIRRDELILSARERGAGWNAISEAIGISRAQLHNIAVKHADRLAKAVPATYADDEPF